MTTVDLEDAVSKLCSARPGRDRVDFQVIALGSGQKPWSVWEEGGNGRTGHGWTAYIPNREIHESRSGIDRLGGEGFPKLDCRSRHRLGLGSAYAFLSDEDELLYVGAAGDQSIEGCIRRHLRGYEFAEVGGSGRPVLRFPRNRWAGVRGYERIVEGRFYVACVVNMKPWGVFRNPYAAGFTGTNPYKQISLDLEGWIVGTFGKPPLNDRPVRTKGDVRLDRPWGDDPRGRTAKLCEE